MSLVESHMSMRANMHLCCRVRRYLLELPYQIMVLNTKADAYQTFQIPEEQLVEVGLIYEV